MLLGRKMKGFIEKQKARIKWKKMNPNNYTNLVDRSAINNIVVGDYSYGDINAFYNGGDEKLIIGSFCSIGPNVVFVLSADHKTNYFSTYPFKAKITHTAKHEAISKGNIILDDDVWVSCNCTILSGVHIGQGAIVAAGSVVSNDIPPYAIVGGVPAKLIRYRFNSEMIEHLLSIDYSKLSKELIENNLDSLYTELEDIEQLKWMPRKQ